MLQDDVDATNSRILLEVTSTEDNSNSRSMVKHRCHEHSESETFSEEGSARFIK